MQQRTGSAPTLSEKKERERQDLRVVLSSVFKDSDLLSNPSALDRYVTAKPYCILAGVPPRDITVDNKATKDRFTVVLGPSADIRVGGGGIVLRCANKSQPTIEYALKIPRPSLFIGEPEWVRSNYNETLLEIIKHAPLSHENVVQAVNWGQMDVQETPDNPRRLPLDVLLMEWIDGARPLNEYLADSNIDYQNVVATLSECFQALAYIHARSLIHWDIKSDNFLVDQEGHPKLADVGNSRRKDDPNRGKRVYSTRGNPPDTLTPTKRSHRGDPNTSRRIEYELPDLEWDSPWLDMWMLARELNRLFRARDDLFTQDINSASEPDRGRLIKQSQDFLIKFSQDEDTSFALAYLKLLIQRLLRPNEPQSPKWYSSAKDVNHDLGKLLPEFGDAQHLPELQAIPQKVLRLPQSGNAPWTRRIGPLFNSPPVQRLRRHKQLGAVSQVFPGGSHSRLEHAAGVLATTAQYVRALYADRTNPFWRMEIDAKDIGALLLAALLHDIGHLAFGHYLEEMEGLFTNRTHEDYVTLLLDPNGATDVGFGENTRNSAETDRSIVKKVVLEKWGIGHAELDAFLAMARQIINPTHRDGITEYAKINQFPELSPEESERAKADILHSIVNSAIDADKFDYLLRDAHHCGVQYARGIDIDRFYQSLTSVWLWRNGQPPFASIGVTDKGVLPVESLLIARYQMFSCVYWHHTNRALIAMLQHLVLTYVALRGDSVHDIEQQLEKLICRFREKDDEGALLWLKGELLNGNLLGRRKRQIISDIVDGLVGNDRQLLYWAAFELPYIPEPDSPGARIAKNVFDQLSALSEGVAKAGDPAIYVRYRLQVRESFTKELCQYIEREHNKRIDFEDGEILIDVPPAGKDQVENVLVAERDQVHRVQDVSPLANAVKEAFQHWVRKPRVFLSPSTWKRLSKLEISNAAIETACITALKSLVLPQLDLRFEAPKAKVDPADTTTVPQTKRKRRTA